MGNSRQFGASRWRMIALLVFVNLSVLSLVWVSLYASYRQYQDRAEVSSRNTNRLVAHSIAGEIDHIDLALRTAIDEVVRLRDSGAKPGPQELDGFLSRLQSRLPMTDSLRLSDAHGNVIAGSGGVPTGIAIGDRDYFIRLEGGPNSYLPYLFSSLPHPRTNMLII
ncbi:Signal transduction histidine kinase (fragment) [Candidatus Terasakiella magnetica]